MWSCRVTGNGIKFTHIHRPRERETIQAREVSSIQNPHLSIVVGSNHPHWATVKIIRNYDPVVEGPVRNHNKQQSEFIYLPIIMMYVDGISNSIFIGGHFSAVRNPGLVKILSTQREDTGTKGQLITLGWSCHNKNGTHSKIWFSYQLYSTLQTTSPWKPPATIRLSFTVMVLIWTRESVWAIDPGYCCRKTTTMSNTKPITSKILR